MLAIQSIPHAHINNISSSYKQIDIVNLKNEIYRSTQDIVKKYKNSFNLDSELLSMLSTSNIYGDDRFLKIYNDTITEIINDIFNDTADSAKLSIDDIFSPNATLFFTQADKVLSSKKNIYGDNPMDQWTNYVATLRKMLSYTGIRISKNYTPTEFFEELKKRNKNNSSLAGTCQKLVDASKKIESVGVSPRGANGQLTLGAARKLIKSNLSKLFGENIWERIIMLARERALEQYYREEDKIIQKLESMGCTVVVGKKHMGPKTNSLSKQQQIQDGLTTIQLREEGTGNLIASILSYDSIKYRQSYTLSEYKSNWNSNKITRTYYLGNLLLEGNIKSSIAPSSIKLLKQNTIYWAERLGAYLTSNNKWSSLNSDGAYINLLNTLAALRDLTFCDTLAVRVGNRPIQSLSLNEKVYTMSSLMDMSKTMNIEAWKSSFIGETSVNQLYINYITNQEKDKIINKTDPTAINNYKNLIDILYQQKIHCSIDLFALTGYNK